jgi:citrate lyase subunit beta/citryl-CoA lyase
MRLRRSQLAVPGSSEKMLTKAAASAADHVFCDLEDAVAPSAKPAARETIAEALNNLDWGQKTRCVRVNDIGTQWCYEDIITLVEKPVRISTRLCCPNRSMRRMCNLPIRC